MLKYLASLKKMPFYAVARGRKTGIFKTWPDCQQQVIGFKGPVFKKFNTISEAEGFIKQHADGTSIASTSSTEVPLVTASIANKTIAVKRTNSSSNLAVPEKKSKINEQKTAEFTANIVKMARHGNYDFIEDSNGYSHVYTDGSCENNGQPNAAAGLGVWFGEGHPLNTSAPVVGPPTNNRGEIQAATKAISDAANNGIEKLCINTDSHFVKNSATKWMANWKSNGWRLASGGPVKNESDFRELDRAIQNNRHMNIQWNYVPAHSGIRGNERADELAKQGAQAYRNGRH